MCRVDRKKKGDDRALPDIAGQPLERREREKGVRGVKDHINKMMRTGVQSEQPSIDHV
jgi:hypothetical protein